MKATYSSGSTRGLAHERSDATRERGELVTWEVGLAKEKDGNNRSNKEKIARETLTSAANDILSPCGPLRKKASNLKNPKRRERKRRARERGKGDRSSTQGLSYRCQPDR